MVASYEYQLKTYAEAFEALANSERDHGYIVSSERSTRVFFNDIHRFEKGSKEILIFRSDDQSVGTAKVTAKSQAVTEDKVYIVGNFKSFKGRQIQPFDKVLLVYK